MNKEEVSGRGEKESQVNEKQEEEEEVGKKSVEDGRR